MLGTILHQHQVTGAVNGAVVINGLAADDKKFLIATMTMRDRGVSRFHFIQMKPGPEAPAAIELERQPVGFTPGADIRFEFDVREVNL
jgi:hypothetical protein